MYSRTWSRGWGGMGDVGHLCDRALTTLGFSVWDQKWEFSYWKNKLLKGRETLVDCSQSNVFKEISASCWPEQGMSGQRAGDGQGLYK